MLENHWGAKKFLSQILCVKGEKLSEFYFKQFKQTKNVMFGLNESILQARTHTYLYPCTYMYTYIMF